jgi:hypothetical protein
VAEENEGGFGGGVRDTRMHERAIRDRWPVPPDKRASIIERLVKIVESSEVGEREATSAAKALIAADKLNLEYQRFDHDTQPPEAPADDYTIDLSSADDPAQQGDPSPA